MFSRISQVRPHPRSTAETFPSIILRSDTSTRSIRDSSRRRPRRPGTWTGPARSPGSTGSVTHTRRGSTGRGTRTHRGSTGSDRCRSRPGDRASTRGHCGLRVPDTMEVMVTRTSEVRGQDLRGTMALPLVTHLLNTSDTMDHLQVCTELKLLVKTLESSKVTFNLIRPNNTKSFPI